MRFDNLFCTEIYERTSDGGKLFYNTQLNIESNICTYSPDLTKHYHEEADMLLILQAPDAARKGFVVKFYIYSPDTDVLVLVIDHYNGTGLSYFLHKNALNVFLTLNIKT